MLLIIKEINILTNCFILLYVEIQIFFSVSALAFDMFYSITFFVLFFQYVPCLLSCFTGHDPIKHTICQSFVLVTWPWVALSFFHCGIWSKLWKDWLVMRLLVCLQPQFLRGYKLPRNLGSLLAKRNIFTSKNEKGI